METSYKIPSLMMHVHNLGRLEVKYLLCTFLYSVDSDKKSFVQYLLWVFTVCHSPRLLQIDLNKILTILFRNDMRV